MSYVKEIVARITPRTLAERPSLTRRSRVSGMVLILNLLGCGAPDVNKINGIEIAKADRSGLCLSNGDGCGDCFDNNDFALTSIWFYCKQLLPVPHCHSGMVRAINVETTNKSFPEFANLAAGAELPGQVEGGFVGVGASATGTPFIPSGALYFNSAVTTVHAPSSTSDSVGTPDAGNSDTEPGVAVTSSLSVDRIGGSVVRK
ncbi:hypothetical protein DFH08DRAFT_1084587 [Mycena albidolilacea]|uniref:Uncharacterized protein n=1 Tax=Mycena albidolilacea TaxID=1033008 RepID=A0AAD7EIC4_9AGAR|nr:hypothetical protein DFH08DRAFT_1084587 [Mycena albidolilacea]